MIIETFDNFYDALHFIDFNSADDKGLPHSYFKVELFQTDDKRWRVGIITEQQLELDF